MDIYVIMNVTGFLWGVKAKSMAVTLKDAANILYRVKQFLFNNSTEIIHILTCNLQLLSSYN